ncbi:amidohydrolase family protein [Rhizoctonia solani]|uniref:Amidohydrolase family protein n=1 Tax=Rhizoctonia solani TaxID=456999 RepID=A0A8H8NQT3_9AGAM|nr:amidohydrolase family protein [Rhizoctonia solani]QRW17013.1 amidohydrolase family protein [Rhizoctonia solani]
MSSLARILTDNYFDSVRAEFVKENNVITIDKTNGLILGVSKALDASDPPPADVEVIDLRGLTVMPGFVDTHVHFFLHPYAEASWSDQVTRESVTERTIRAVNHAKATLMAGFTTVRDLGTEGAGDADIGLRKSIVTTGSYGPKTQLHPNAQSVDGVSGAQVADGPAECSRVVRQHIGAGADWVKPESAPSLMEERRVGCIGYNAHTAGVKVAVHANTAEAALAAINAGANSLEHGYGYNEEVFAKLRGGRVVWNPTLSVFNLEPDTRSLHNPMSGIPIAVGGDTGHSLMGPMLGN